MCNHFDLHLYSLTFHNTRVGIKKPSPKKPTRKNPKKPTWKNPAFYGFFRVFYLFFKGFYLFSGFIPFFRFFLPFFGFFYLFSGFLHYFFISNHCKLLILSLKKCLSPEHHSLCKISSWLGLSYPSHFFSKILLNLLEHVFGRFSNLTTLKTFHMDIAHIYRGILGQK